jgi:NAD(P)H-nitrite reductase large subunit
MQGEVAGLNMAGKEAQFERAIAMNAIGFFGLHMLTAGVYEGETYEDIQANSYKKLFYADDRLMGFILIGNIEKAGVYTTLVRDKTPLSSLDFSMVCRNPGLMAFSREDRTQRINVAPRVSS